MTTMRDDDDDYDDDDDDYDDDDDDDDDGDDDDVKPGKDGGKRHRGRGVAGSTGTAPS